MTKPRIYYTKPSITELEVEYATDAARNGWGDRCYEYINRFEDAFKEHLGVQYAIATSSCTGALHMGMAALGIGIGDEVIMADTNWIATAAPIVHLGAKPVFVDILPDSWCIDPDLAEAAITPQTKAIIAVHLYGNLCDMNRLLAIGEKYGIPVIEDAAEAIGSVYHGKQAGSMGKFGSFSFHGTKTLTTGEGGMFVTNDADLYETVLTLSNHGRARGQTKQFWADMVGFKYKMSNIQAAIGYGQMQRIDELINRKREILSFYKKHLECLDGISMNPDTEGMINGAWMPTIVFDKQTGITREKLQSIFKSENIDARVFFHPLSSLSMFEDREVNINSWNIPLRSINLPSYHDLSTQDIKRVAQEIVDEFYLQKVNKMNQLIKVMIAGIGGASLGTEIYKSLRLAKIYDVFGCDISPTAYGMYENGFSDTYHIASNNYAKNVLDVCVDAGVKWLIPGGEQPMQLLGQEAKMFAAANIHVVANSPNLISICSNKKLTFSELAELGISIPKTIPIQNKSDLDYIGLPCIVKPSTGTGGSVSVFFAISIEEAMVYAEFIKRNGSEPIAQEYIDISEGEFTIGVLSLPNKKIVGSIALKRELSAKLSVAYRGRGGIISSGYSQGYIDEYPELCMQAENIAKSLNSAGPINIQARVRNGKLMPFEINPRFSASTYLRAMAGFNEVDIMLRYLALQIEPQRPLIQTGWYLRSLTEQYVSEEVLR